MKETAVFLMQAPVLIRKAGFARIHNEKRRRNHPLGIPLKESRRDFRQTSHSWESCGHACVPERHTPRPARMTVEKDLPGPNALTWFLPDHKRDPTEVLLGVAAQEARHRKSTLWSRVDIRRALCNFMRLFLREMR